MSNLVLLVFIWSVSQRGHRLADEGHTNPLALNEDSTITDVVSTAADPASVELNLNGHTGLNGSMPNLTRNSVAIAIKHTQSSGDDHDEHEEHVNRKFRTKFLIFFFSLFFI